MKKTITLLLLFSATLGCRAQVLDTYTTLSWQTPPNAYLKDIQNFQNQFVGTWVYQNGLETLEVRLVKKEMMVINPGPNQYYEDVLVGEYSYVDTMGVVRVNSLSNLLLNPNNKFSYHLFSGAKLALDCYPACPNCPIGTERLYLHFDEPANDDMGLAAGFVIRRVIENGVEKLKVQYYNVATAFGRKKGDFTQPSTFTNFSLPYGEYTLLKL